MDLLFTNILDVECHSYGVSASGEGDISHYVHETLDRDEYGYVIIFHTDPTRPSRYCEEDHSFKNCKRLMNDLKDYNVLHMYWDEQHRFFDYSDDNGKEIFISNYHVTNPTIHQTFAIPLIQIYHLFQILLIIDMDAVTLDLVTLVKGEI